MAKPTPAPLDAADVTRLVNETIKDAKFPLD